MSFPLYDILIKDVKNIELSKDEKLQIIDTIKTLDRKGQDNMYTLIRLHGLKTNSDSNIFEIPYNGQGIDKGNGCRDIKFNIDKFPPILSQIIFKFTNMQKKI